METISTLTLCVLGILAVTLAIYILITEKIAAKLKKTEIEKKKAERTYQLYKELTNRFAFNEMQLDLDENIPEEFSILIQNELVARQTIAEGIANYLESKETQDALEFVELLELTPFSKNKLEKQVNLN